MSDISEQADRDQGTRSEGTPASGDASPARRRGRLPGRRFWLSLAGAAVALPGAYALAGYMLVPSLIRSQATQWTQQRLGKTLTLGDIRFDPFRLTLDIDDAAIGATARQPMVAFGHLHLDFAARSLFEHAWRFEEVRLDRPFVDAVMRPNGSLNLADLVPKSEPGAAQGASPAVRIDRFTLGQGKLRFADERRPGRPEVTFRPLGFTLRDFETDAAQGGAFSLKAKSLRDEAIAWTGTLSLAPVVSRGRFSVTGLRAETVQGFLGAYLPLRLTGGQARLDGRYDFAWRADGMQLSAALPDVSLTGVALADGPATKGGLGLLDRATLGHAALRVDRLFVATGGKDGLRVEATVPELVLGDATLVDPLGIGTGRGGSTLRLGHVRLTDARYDLRGGTMSLAGIELERLGLAAPRLLHGEEIRFAGAQLDGAKVDLGAHRVALGRLALSGAELPLRREANGAINWMALMPATGGAAKATRDGAGTVAGKPWSFALASAALSGGVLRFEDHAVAPVTRFVLRPLTVEARSISGDMSRPLDLRFAATLNGTTRLGGAGTLVPAGGIADLRVTLANLPLLALRPYLPTPEGLELKAGVIGATGQLHLAGGDLAAVRYRGGATIDRFIADDTLSHSPFVAWRAFALQGIDYRASGVTIDHGRLDGPVGRVEILADGRFNYTAMTGGAAAGAEGGATTGSQTAGTDRTSAKAAEKAAGKVADTGTPDTATNAGAARIAEAGGTGAAGATGTIAATGQVAHAPAPAAASLPAAPIRAATAENRAPATGGAQQALPSAGAAGPAGVAPATSAQSPASVASPAAAMPALPVRIRRLDVRGGMMRFADFSIDPNFQADIEGLQGHLENVGNVPGSVSSIDLAGHVIDRFSPVTIQGQMDLFSYDRRTDMHVAFRNIELPVFNPYSGRYAGYAIAKGKLSAQFDYRIEDRALKADHHVVIDQLKWGQATESKQKVPLPIRLATALLKDKNGVIDLAVPVTGSLDDPHFRLAPIVWKIIGNVIEKAITAPFRLLGSIFGGAEKARYVDFAPGSAVLPEGAKEAFAGLAKALEKRDELELDIPAGPGIREDATAMADRRIDAQLMAKEAKKGEPADFAALKPDAQHDRLKALFRAKLGRKPDFAALDAEAAQAGEAAAKAGTEPAAPKGPDGKPLGKGEARRLREIAWMRDQLRAAYQPSNAELEALGKARAIAVRDALLADGSIAPERLFLVTGDQVSDKDGVSRMELKLK